MTKPDKKIPSFKNELEERAFWESNDSTEFLDWTKAKLETLPKLKPNSEKKLLDSAAETKKANR